jgi:hypothetical protein
MTPKTTFFITVTSQDGALVGAGPAETYNALQPVIAQQEAEGNHCAVVQSVTTLVYSSPKKSVAPKLTVV